MSVIDLTGTPYEDMTPRERFFAFEALRGHRATNDDWERAQRIAARSRRTAEYVQRLDRGRVPTGATT